MAKLKEQRAFASFKDACLGVLNLKRIENSITAGMPDVKGINRIGTSFWIEVKALDNWPARATTPPLKGAFEKGQLAFLKEWISWRGRSFVLLRVKLDYLLLDPKLELESIGRDDLIDSAIVKGRSEIIEYLKELE